MTPYRTEKIDDPRQVDVEDYIAEKNGEQPQRRHAVALGANGEKLNTEREYETINTMYAPLRRVLNEAFSQSSVGKGYERHANGKSFMSQPIMEITRMHGIGFSTGQSAKKAQEACGMVSRGEYEAAKRELLGAIVYIAAACLWVEEVAEENSVDE